MKDESGVLTYISEALKQNMDDSLKGKLNLVKNEFLTRRQVGESELYYRFFPWLHLVHSNIGCEFVTTGFKENRSRFLKKQIGGGTKNGIEVDGYDGKYVEKENMLEKYERQPKELHKNLTYSQFVKRYTLFSQEVPQKYDFLADLKKKVTKVMVANVDYIFGKSDSEVKVKLPDYIPLSKGEGGEFTWMKKRAPKVLRIHKFKEKTKLAEQVGKDAATTFDDFFVKTKFFEIPRPPAGSPGGPKPNKFSRFRAQARAYLITQSPDAGITEVVSVKTHASGLLLITAKHKSGTTVVGLGPSVFVAAGNVLGNAQKLN